MLKINTLIVSVKKNIEFIVMNSDNITKYLDLYNYDIERYETMDEYILDNYNYELLGKRKSGHRLKVLVAKKLSILYLI